MKLWKITFAVFLVIYAVLAMTNVQIQFAPFVQGCLAIATAALLLFDK